jgi:hypothetical protein
LPATAPGLRRESVALELIDGFSTLVCTLGSLSPPGRAGLGTKAGEARLHGVMLEGGFGSVRRAAETPLNLVLEARA